MEIPQEIYGHLFGFVVKYKRGDNMAFDFKKEYKEFYLPENKPSQVIVPPMQYIAVRGQGDPNEEGGAYKEAVSVLYAIAYTIKMSYKGSRKIEGFFEYVVPPLEGFWELEGEDVNAPDKSRFKWISVIRLPDFAGEEDFKWACGEVCGKKNIDCSKAELLRYDEGLCVQMMHKGSYDDEPRSLKLMDEYIAERGYASDIGKRLHHEIYLSDPRRCAKDKLKTVLRVPVKKA